MYAYFSGKVVSINSNKLILDVNGIGFEILVDDFTVLQSKINEQAVLYTVLIVREDEWLLYGFNEKSKKEIFRKLITVNGIGPRLALAVISHVSVSDIYSAIEGADVSVFESVSGVGKKTAQRIVMELKEKVDISQLGEVSVSNGSCFNDAVAALIELGCVKSEAIAAVNSVKGLGDSAEDLVRMALKRLDR